MARRPPTPGAALDLEGLTRAYNDALEELRRIAGLTPQEWGTLTVEEYAALADGATTRAAFATMADAWETLTGHALDAPGTKGRRQRIPPGVNPYQGRTHARIGSGHVGRTVLAAVHDAENGTDWENGGGQSVPVYAMRRGSPLTVTYGSPDDAQLLSLDALAQLWEAARQLDDWTSDALCVVMAAIESVPAGASATGQWIRADTILDARGIEPKRYEAEGGLWRHGHRTEDRQRAGRALEQLQHLHVQGTIVIKRGTGGRPPITKPINSRVLAILDSVEDVDERGARVLLSARVGFGLWADAYREVGAWGFTVLAQQALKYDPNNHRIEKRLAKFIAFHSRVNRRRERLPLKVWTLLRESGLEVDTYNPQRTRRRLEAALDRLAADGVIAGWGYAGGNPEQRLPARGWVAMWEGLSVLIEAAAPPASVLAPVKALPGA